MLLHLQNHPNDIPLNYMTTPSQYLNLTPPSYPRISLLHITQFPPLQSYLFPYHSSFLPLSLLRSRISSSLSPVLHTLKFPMSRVTLFSYSIPLIIRPIFPSHFSLYQFFHFTLNSLHFLRHTLAIPSSPADSSLSLVVPYHFYYFLVV